jgi:hypothetical protein
MPCYGMRDSEQTLQRILTDQTPGDRPDPGFSTTSERRESGVDVEDVTMKRKLVVGVLSAVFALVMGARAQALTIVPGDAEFTTNDNSGPGTDALLAQAGLTSADLLYKQDVGGPESGDFASSYETTFSNTPADPEDALIEYISGASITCPECWLLVKDGNQEPAQYLFNIDEWNGTDDIVMTGFWPEQGAISHVSIYSSPGETVDTSDVTVTSDTVDTSDVTVTPEPATLALFGSGLAIAAARLRRRKTVSRL